MDLRQLSLVGVALEEAKQKSDDGRGEKRGQGRIGWQVAAGRSRSEACLLRTATSVSVSTHCYANGGWALQPCLPWEYREGFGSREILISQRNRKASVLSRPGIYQPAVHPPPPPPSTALGGGSSYGEAREANWVEPTLFEPIRPSYSLFRSVAPDRRIPGQASRARGRWGISLDWSCLLVIYCSPAAFSGPLSACYLSVSLSALPSFVSYLSSGLRRYLSGICCPLSSLSLPLICKLPASCLPDKPTPLPYS